MTRRNEQQHDATSNDFDGRRTSEAVVLDVAEKIAGTNPAMRSTMRALIASRPRSPSER